MEQSSTVVGLDDQKDTIVATVLPPHLQRRVTS